jgi:hypothetical protein
MMLAKKKVTCMKAPTASNGASNLLNQKFAAKGKIVMAHMSRVTCHLFGTYSGLLKIANPTMTLDTSEGLDVHEHIHANTVIQPCMSPKKRLYFGAKVADHLY